MKKLKAIILGIVAIAEAIYLVDSLYGISLFYNDSDRNIFAFTVLSAIHALLLMLITIGGIIRLKVKEKFSLIKNLVMLPVITFLILGTGYPIAYDKSEDVLIASVFFILLFAVSFGIFVFVCGYEKHIVKKEKKQKSVALPFEQKGFTGYNCEWIYDDAADEYCCIHGISEDSLYDEDELADKVWYYSYVYISYFVVWLARHHYLLNDLAYQQNKNFNTYVTDMQNETGEPVSLIQQMDGHLYPDDVRPSVHGFLTEYLDGECRYSADYESVIAKYSDYCYCNDFLWEIYHELEKLIDKAFREYCIGKEA